MAKPTRPHNRSKGGDLPVFCYLRKSQSEEEDEEALWKHEQALKRLAEAEGWSLPEAHIYREVRSGENLSRRPRMRALLDRLRKLDGGGAVLLCMHEDRLSRGLLMERGQIQDLLYRKRVLIRTPTGTTDLSNPDQCLLYEVKGALARHELGRYKRRVQEAREEMMLSGAVRTGRVPYGWRWDKGEGKVLPHPDQFPVVVSWCREVHSTSLHALARKYQMSRKNLWRVLTNPFIAGWPAWRWSLDEDGESYLLPREEWRWPKKPGDYPAACTLAEWEAIQTVLARRRVSPIHTTGEEDGWCREILRFRGSDRRPKLSAMSRGRLIYQIDREPSLYIARAAVHRTVFALIVSVLTPARLGAAMQAYERLMSEADECAQETEAEIHAGLLALDQQLATLILREIREPGDTASLRIAQEKVRHEKKDLERRLLALKSGRRAVPALSQFPPELAALPARDWATVWEKRLDPETKALVAQAILDWVEVEVAPVSGQQKWRREVVAWQFQWPFRHGC